jgi:hypothetical protein
LEHRNLSQKIKVRQTASLIRAGRFCFARWLRLRCFASCCFASCLRWLGFVLCLCRFVLLAGCFASRSCVALACAVVSCFLVARCLRACFASCFLVSCFALAGLVCCRSCFASCFLVAVACLCCCVVAWPSVLLCWLGCFLLLASCFLLLASCFLLLASCFLCGASLRGLACLAWPSACFLCLLLAWLGCFASCF